MIYINIEPKDDMNMARAKIKQIAKVDDLKKLYMVGVPIEFMSDRKVLNIRRGNEFFPTMKIEGISSTIEKLIPELSY